MLTGVPEVRGFRLDGYGVFFDVEVPALRLPLDVAAAQPVSRQPRADAESSSELRAMMVEPRAAGPRAAGSRSSKRLEQPTRPGRAGGTDGERAKRP